MKKNPYLIARDLHRLLMWATIVVVAIMGMTGIFLKFPIIANRLGLDLDLIRFLHSNFSLVFSLVMILMAGSGVVMYFYTRKR